MARNCAGALICNSRQRYDQSVSRTTHNMSRSPVYALWHTMINRCHHPGTNGFDYYGARGIVVCPRWRQSFAAFYADMGARPSPNHSIDRLDNDRGYEPGNCVWATSHQQARNRRTTRMITAFGKTQCLSDWAVEFGLKVITLHRRLKNGVPFEDAVSIPLNHARALRLARR